MKSKILSIYLPQFHAIPENDEWWGTGFTEWVNVKRGRKFYPGHYQPREPLHDDYYDLSDIKVLEKHTKLAKKAGISGFCFYQYYFCGKKLLEKPIETYRDYSKADFPYCLIWANESWMRTWYRAPANNTLLMRQVYGDENEWKEFEHIEVDYSGLRVQAMQISEKEEDDNEKREDPGDNWEEGRGGSGAGKSPGPWNKTVLVQAPPAPVTVTETPGPAMPSGVFRPPEARLTTTRKTPQGPPEIYSDTQFPSLQSTAKHVESRKDKEMEKSFEVVRHKNRDREEVSKNQALKLQLDNQYAVLENQKYSHTQYR